MRTTCFKQLTTRTCHISFLIDDVVIDVADIVADLTLAHCLARGDTETHAEVCHKQ